MGKDKLIHLRNTLLQGGVAYKHVIRFIAELRDHYVDLQQEAASNGSKGNEANKQATAKLGQPEVLVQEMLRRPEFRSYGYRYPKMFMVAMPVFFYFLISVLLIFLMVGSTTLFSPENNEVIREAPISLVILLTCLKYVMMYGLPLLMFYIVLNYAIHNQIGMKYYALGLLLLALLSSSVNVYLSWPDPVNATQGSLSVSISIIRMVFPPDFFLRLGVCLLFTFGLKHYISQKMLNEFENIN